MWFRLFDTALFNMDLCTSIMGIPMNQQAWDQESRSKMFSIEIARPWWWRTIKTRVSWCESPISNKFYTP